MRAGPLVAWWAGLTLAAVATVAGTFCLWWRPPVAGDGWVGLVALIWGTGFAAAAGSVPSVAGRTPNGTAGGTTSARLLLLAGLTLLAGPLVLAAGHPRVAATVAAAGAVVGVPAALLRVVPVRRAVGATRVLEALLLGSGVAVTVAAALADQELAGIGLVVGVGALLCLGWLRFELSEGEERRRLLWLVLGVGASTVGVALFLVAMDDVALAPTGIRLVASMFALIIPVCAGLALAPQRAVDVRAVIRDVALAVVMVAIVVAFFTGSAAVLRLVTGEPATAGPLTVVALLIGVGFHPVLVRARVTMDELLFGGRPDAEDVLDRLGRELVAGSSPQEWLDAVREALGVPALVLRSEGEVLASSGGADDVARLLAGADASAAVPGGVTPLRAGEFAVGELLAAPAAGQIRLPPGARSVLGLVAGPLAQALHAVRLSEQLQASRERLVAALEEERRRVRRDLHDGLGPTLTGIAYSADAAANLSGASDGPDDGQVGELLRGLRADAGEAIAEVRRIVYGLRPRALDELGLVGAVRQRVERLRRADGSALVVRLQAPDDLPELPAAVEVAAFRVAVEAVTNVARHAGVGSASVEFALVDDELRVLVLDPAPGGPAWRPGVGLTSMRERVELVGGSLVAGAAPDGGRVEARLPLRH